MASRWAVILRWRSTNAGSCDRRGPGEPAAQCFFAFVAADGEDVAESFFEQVGAPELRVGLGDPVELVALPVGEVVGVLPEGVAGPLGARAVPVERALRGAGAGLLPAGGGVPGPAPFDVEGVDAPGDDVERIGAAQRVGGPAGDDPGDPIGHVSGDVGEQGARVRAPSWSKNTSRAASLRPGPAHTSRPVSWSTTTIR